MRLLSLHRAYEDHMAFVKIASCCDTSDLAVLNYLILNHSDTLAMRLCQQVVQESCFA